MRFVLLIAFALLPRCADRDIADDFVIGGPAISLTPIAREEQIFVCVLAVYRISSATEPPDLANGFEPWSATRVTERVGETAIELRALRNANECWNAEIREASGSSDVWQYISAAKPMTSFDHSGRVAFFDPQRKIFMAFEG